MRVHSVIVCFHPDIQRLMRLSGHLAAAGSRVTLVDNTPQSQLAGESLPPGVELVALGANTGIAHAQNVGIRRALDDGADVLVFFDQDSVVSPEFLRDLIAPLVPGVAAVIAPRCLDEATGRELPAAKIGRWGWAQPVFTQPEPHALVPVDVVIASGSAATRQTFERAGFMDEALFIDFVDTEWCLRCRSRGVAINVNTAVSMQHSIGSRSIDAGLLTLLVHSPARCYYQIRNALLLFRRPHVPWRFAFKEAASVMLGRLFLLFHVKDKAMYWKAYRAAIRDGMRGASGAMSPGHEPRT